MKRSILILLVGTPLALIGLIVYANYSPHLLINPITRHLYSLRDEPRGTALDLVPDVFALGETRDVVLARLENAGFRLLHSDEDPEHGTGAAYVMGAGGNFACGFENYVAVEFAGGRLTDAEGRFLWTCL